jgi:hypothetical protein
MVEELVQFEVGGPNCRYGAPSRNMRRPAVSSYSGAAEEEGAIHYLKRYWDLVIICRVKEIP